MKLTDSVGGRLAVVVVPPLVATVILGLFKMTKKDFAVMGMVVLTTWAVVLVLKWILSGKWSWDPITPPFK